MSLNHALNSPARQRRALSLLALAVLALLLFGLRGLAGPTPETAAAPRTDAADGNDATLPVTAIGAAAEQQAAQAAVAREIGRPAPARVTERPDYVSAMEWLALQAVAQKSADQEQELTRLVANLRFHKLLEQWRAGNLEATRQRTLGEQLLAELPARVRQREYGVAPAQELQVEVVAALEPDPAARAARLAAEAQRLRAMPLLQEQRDSAPR